MTLPLTDVISYVFIDKSNVCDLSDIKSAVIISLFGIRGHNLSDGATNRREILHDGRYCSRTGLLPFGGTPIGPHNPTFGLRISRKR